MDSTAAAVSINHRPNRSSGVTAIVTATTFAGPRSSGFSRKAKNWRPSLRTVSPSPAASALRINSSSSLGKSSRNSALACRRILRSSAALLVSSGTCSTAKALLARHAFPPIGSSTRNSYPTSTVRLVGNPLVETRPAPIAQMAQTIIHSRHQPPKRASRPLWRPVTVFIPRPPIRPDIAA